MQEIKESQLASWCRRKFEAEGRHYVDLFVNISMLTYHMSPTMQVIVNNSEIEMV